MKEKDITNDFVLLMVDIIKIGYPYPASYETIEDLVLDWICYTVKKEELEVCKDVYDVIHLFLNAEWEGSPIRDFLKEGV